MPDLQFRKQVMSKFTQTSGNDILIAYWTTNQALKWNLFTFTISHKRTRCKKKKINWLLQDGSELVAWMHADDISDYVQLRFRETSGWAGV